MIHHALFKQTLPAYLAAVFAMIFLGATVHAEPPVCEATFNNSDNWTLENGAQLGADGSGVSGKPGDKSYTADSSKVPAGGSKGPKAEFNNSVMPIQNLDELTVTAWYKPHGAMSGAATLIDAVGTTLLWDPKGAWTLRILTRPPNDTKWYYWFTTDTAPPLGSWGKPEEWTFFAAVWKRKEAKVTFYQGSKSTVSAEAGEKTRQEAVDPLCEYPNHIRTIGNSQGLATDRPFNGDVDDVRFFAKALDATVIEKIRQADLNNEPVGSLSTPSSAPSPGEISTNAPTASAPAKN